MDSNYSQIIFLALGMFILVNYFNFIRFFNHKKHFEFFKDRQPIMFKEENFIGELEACDNFKQINGLWRSYKFHNKDLLVISLDYTQPDYEKIPTKQMLYHSEYFCSFFQSNTIKLINNHNVELMKNKGKSIIAIDYTLMFDSNLSSYISNAIRTPSKLKKEERRTLLDILKNEVNFDFFFYLLENHKQIPYEHWANQPTKNEFWQSLKKGFQDNLIDLVRFKNIKACNAEAFSPSISEEDAKTEAIDISYDLYVKNREQLNFYIQATKIIELILLKILEINFSSDKSSDKKFDQLVDFYNEEGIYSDRDSRLALEYFNKKKMKYFEKIQPNVNMDETKFRAKFCIRISTCP